MRDGGRKKRRVEKEKSGGRNSGEMEETKEMERWRDREWRRNGE